MATSTGVQPLVPRLQSAQSDSVSPRSPVSVDERKISCDDTSTVTTWTTSGTVASVYTACVTPG